MATSRGRKGPLRSSPARGGHGIRGGRPSRGRRGPVRGRSGHAHKPWAAILVAVAVVGLLTSGLLFLTGPQRPPGARFVWVAEKTTAAPGAVPEGLITAAYDAAGGHGGELVVYPVGRQAKRLQPVSLTVVRNGDILQDERLRKMAIDKRLTQLRGAIDGALVGDEGFSLYAALQAMADEAAKADGRIDVWFSTTVLTGSVDPLRIPALTAADAGAAVAEIMKGKIQRLDLSKVDLHPVLLVPVGLDQQPLTAVDEAWRNDFVIRLGEALGATVKPPVRSDTGQPTWDAPAFVPPVVPLPDATPTLELQACANDTCVIDNLAFKGDEATLIDRETARLKVATFVDALPPPGNRRIVVTGFTAAIGDAKTSRDLSRERARVIAELLQAEGVTLNEIEIEGLGFDRRADPTKPPADPAQRVVVLTLKQRG